MRSALESEIPFTAIGDREENVNLAALIDVKHRVLPHRRPLRLADRKVQLAVAIKVARGRPRPIEEDKESDRVDVTALRQPKARQYAQPVK